MTYLRRRHEQLCSNLKKANVMDVALFYKTIHGDDGCTAQENVAAMGCSSPFLD